MKALKKLVVAFVLIAGLGITFASCSDDYTDIPGEPTHPIQGQPSNPIEGVPEIPPIVDPR